MFTLRRGLAWSLIGHATVLSALTALAGSTPIGWAVGAGCALTMHVAIAYGVFGVTKRLGPADLITLARSALSCGVASLVADSFVQRPALPFLVGLATVALVLDAVDGRVARRTHTTSRFGARFDGDVDAFLILVLSAYATHVVGPWVLTIGAARYLFAAAGMAFPWLRARLPARHWRKVVAAVQGITLTFAAAEIAPPAVTTALLVIALILLAESFGRDVWWLWRQHTPSNPDRVTRATPS